MKLNLFEEKIHAAHSSAIIGFCLVAVKIPAGQCRPCATLQIRTFFRQITVDSSHALAHIFKTICNT